MWTIALCLKQPSDCLARFHLKPTAENLNYLLRMPSMTISYSLRRERAAAYYRFSKAFYGDGYPWVTTNALETVTGQSHSLYASRDFKSPEVHKERPP